MTRNYPMPSAARRASSFALRLSLLIGTFLSSAAMAGTPTPEIDGWWLDDSGRAAIMMAPCAEGICGTIEWMKEPLDPATGKPKLNIHDPVPAQRSQPICGLKLMWGFRPDRPNHWTDGTVYDPESGNTYNAEASLGADGALNLRGYILIPLIGRTKSFFRPPATPTPCTDP